MPIRRLATRILTAVRRRPREGAPGRGDGAHLESPANLARLRAAMREIDEGRGIPMTVAELGTLVRVPRSR